jgi:general secretion pathway protein A
MSPERIIFTPSVVRGVYRATRGIPRIINVLCDRMLMGAYGRNASRVDSSMLKLAVREVLGEQEASALPWRWLLAGVALMLLVWAGGWLLGKYTAATDATPARTDASVAGEFEETDAAATDTAATETAATPSIAVPAPLDAATPAAASAIEQAAAAEVVESVAPPVVGIPAAMLPADEGAARLWALNTDLPAPDAPCANGGPLGLACVEGEVWTWEELSAFDRPLLLETITPERFAAEVLLLGISVDQAWVLMQGEVVQVSLADLAPFWTGRYRFLWHPPPGFERPLSVGDDSDVVAEIAHLFAKLDQQPLPLAERRFTRGLQQRVRLFQQQNGLVDDGVVGMQTLLKLNEQLGIDVTAAQARQRLQGAQIPQAAP